MTRNPIRLRAGQSIRFEPLAGFLGLQVLAGACAPENPAPSTLHGAVYVDGASSLDQLDGVSSIEGDLILANSGVTVLELPELRRIGGRLEIVGTSIERLTLPQLAELGELEIRNNAALTELDLPTLRAVANVSFHGNDALAALSLPNLVQAGDLSIDGCPALVVLELPSLEGVGRLVARAFQKLALPKLAVAESIDGDASLTELSAPSLRELHLLGLADAKALETLALPALEHVDDVYIISDRIQRIELPRLVFLNSLSAIVPMLSGLDLSSLRTAGRLDFSSQALATLDLPQLEQADTIFVANADSAAVATVALHASRLRTVGYFHGQAIGPVLGLPGLERVGTMYTSGLSSVALPELVTAGELQLIGALSQINLPKLATAGRVYVGSEGLACDARVLFPALAEPELTVEFREDTCP